MDRWPWRQYPLWAWKKRAGQDARPACAVRSVVVVAVEDRLFGFGGHAQAFSGVHILKLRAFVGELGGVGIGEASDERPEHLVVGVGFGHANRLTRRQLTHNVEPDLH